MRVLPVAGRAALQEVLQLLLAAALLAIRNKTTLATLVQIRLPRHYPQPPVAHQEVLQQAPVVVPETCKPTLATVVQTINLHQTQLPTVQIRLLPVSKALLAAQEIPLLAAVQTLVTAVQIKLPRLPLLLAVRSKIPLLLLLSRRANRLAQQTHLLMRLLTQVAHSSQTFLALPIPVHPNHLKGH